MSAERQAFELELRPAAESVAQARRSVDGLRGVLREELLEDLRLLVSELVTNSVRHAGLATSDRVELRIVVGPKTVRTEIADPGPGFLPPPSDPVAGAPSGWGLFLVERLADRWGVDRRDGHTRVWFELDR